MSRTHTTLLRKDVNIDYVATPTGRLFHNDGSFVRGMLGPVGCTPGYTEFLTPAGWKAISDYREGDRLAVWHPDGSLRFEAPEAYIVAPSEGFHTFSNRHSVDMEVSPAHRVPLYDWKGQFVVKTAAQLAAKPSRHHIPIHWTVADTPGLPLTDEQVRVMVMVHADGNFRKDVDTYRCTVAVRKERKLLRAKMLLESANIPYAHNTYHREEGGVQVAEHQIAFQAPERTKGYDSWWGANAAQLNIIMDEVFRWDGLNKHAEARFYTTHKGCADFIQYAAHACGRRASVGNYVDARDATWAPVYTVYVTKPGSLKSRAMIRGDNLDIGFRSPEPGEQQYCFTTSTGFWVMRHRGVVAVTGNSGKTVAMCMEMLSKSMQEHPGPDGMRRTRWLVARSSYPELKSTTIASFLDWMGPLGSISYDSPIRYECHLPLGDGTTMEMVVWFKPIDGSQTSLDGLRSLELTAAFVNEAHEFSDEVISLLKGRVGRYRPHKGQNPRWSGIIMDSNYGSNSCPLKLMIDQNHPDHAFFEQPAAVLWDIHEEKWTVNENAENLQNLPYGVQYYERQVAGTPDYLIRQLLACRWATPRSAKPIFPEYSHATHVHRGVMAGDKSLPLMIGMDFGLHVACVFGQMTKTGGLRVLDELWDDDAALDDFIPKTLVPLLNKKYRGFSVMICGDPAGGGRSALDKRTPFSVLKKAGFVAYPAATNDPVQRRDALRAFLLRTNGYLMNSHCTRLDDALSGAFGYKRKPDGTFSDQAEKNEESHVAEAAEYLALAVRYPQARNRAMGKKKQTTAIAPEYYYG